MHHYYRDDTAAAALSLHGTRVYQCTTVYSPNPTRAPPPRPPLLSRINVHLDATDARATIREPSRIRAAKTVEG